MNQRSRLMHQLQSAACKQRKKKSEKKRVKRRENPFARQKILYQRRQGSEKLEKSTPSEDKKKPPSFKQQQHDQRKQNAAKHHSAERPRPHPTNPNARHTQKRRSKTSDDRERKRRRLSGTEQKKVRSIPKMFRKSKPKLERKISLEGEDFKKIQQKKVGRGSSEAIQQHVRSVPKLKKLKPKPQRKVSLADILGSESSDDDSEEVKKIEQKKMVQNQARTQPLSTERIASKKSAHRLNESPTGSPMKFAGIYEQNHEVIATLIDGKVQWKNGHTTVYRVKSNSRILVTMPLNMGKITGILQNDGRLVFNEDMIWTKKRGSSEATQQHIRSVPKLKKPKPKSQRKVSLADILGSESSDDESEEVKKIEQKKMVQNQARAQLLSTERIAPKKPEDSLNAGKRIGKHSLEEILNFSDESDDDDYLQNQRDRSRPLSQWKKRVSKWKRRSETEAKPQTDEISDVSEEAKPRMVEILSGPNEDPIEDFSSDQASPEKPGGGNEHQVFEDKWICKRCTLHNNIAHARCQACEAPRPTILRDKKPKKKLKRVPSLFNVSGRQKRLKREKKEDEKSVGEGLSEKSRAKKKPTPPKKSKKKTTAFKGTVVKQTTLKLAKRPPKPPVRKFLPPKPKPKPKPVERKEPHCEVYKQSSYCRVYRQIGLEPSRKTRSSLSRLYQSKLRKLNFETRLSGREGYITRIEFDSDAVMMAVASSNGSITTYNTEAKLYEYFDRCKDVGEEANFRLDDVTIWNKTIQSEYRVDALAFRPQKRAKVQLLFGGMHNSDLYKQTFTGLGEPPAMKCLDTRYSGLPRGYRHGITDVTYYQSGKCVAGATKTGYIIRFDRRNKAKKSLKSNTRSSAISHLDNPDGVNILRAIHSDGTLVKWDVRNANQPFETSRVVPIGSRINTICQVDVHKSQRKYLGNFQESSIFDIRFDHNKIWRVDASSKRPEKLREHKLHVVEDLPKRMCGFDDFCVIPGGKLVYTVDINRYTDIDNRLETLNRERLQVQVDDIQELSMSQALNVPHHLNQLTNLPDVYTTCATWNFPEIVHVVRKHPVYDYFFVGMNRNLLNVCGPGC